ncbi:hypothetical protein FB451DRAFT_184023 [Mycena latifolia]|nr:hypothetical protein FB451DRAFT_184023 [Mycena latifolia]
MLRLPNELLELILFPLDRRDLWAVVRVSFRLRSLALSRFLAQYNISEQQIRSGTLSIPAESCFLIIVAAHIHPIRKLEILRGSFAMEGPGILPAVLASVPPIPDIVIHSAFGQFSNRAGMAQILSAACHDSMPTFVFIGRGTVNVSPHRDIRPIYWKLVPSRSIRKAWPFALRRLISDSLSLASAALAYLLCGVVNVFVAAAWMYRHIFRVRWQLEERVAADLGDVHAHWMHVRSLLPGTAEQFTLVTFGGARDEWLAIPRLSALTHAQLSVLLDTLELPNYLHKPTIAGGASRCLADGCACTTLEPSRVLRLFYYLSNLYPWRSQVAGKG